MGHGRCLLLSSSTFHGTLKAHFSLEIEYVCSNVSRTCLCLGLVEEIEVLRMLHSESEAESLFWSDSTDYTSKPTFPKQDLEGAIEWSLGALKSKHK